MFEAVAPATALQFSNTQDANRHFANIDGVEVALADVPEPATPVLMLLGVVACMGLRRRR